MRGLREQIHREGALEAERQRGLSPLQAIHEACLERFRPIMMTTLAALLGALPLAVAQQRPDYLLSDFNVYTYDILLYDGAKFGRLCDQARALGILCAPSVGPGYQATAATGDTR